MDNDDASTSAQRMAYNAAQADSRVLRDAINRAIHRQAGAWGIRFDQAQALLLDRQVVA